MTEENKRTWFSKHVDAVVVISAIVGSVCWMNNSIHNVEDRINTKLISLEKDMTVIKTVMVMKNLMPSDLAIKTKE